MEDANTPRRELSLYGQGSPRVTAVTRGQCVSHLPVIVRAHGNQAQFSLTGGKDLVPVLITGLTTWRYPRLWKQEAGQWRLLSHARNSAHDGYQVFCEEDGTFGAVFLVHSNERTQTLRVAAGGELSLTPRLSVSGLAHDALSRPGISFACPTEGRALRLSFPAGKRRDSVVSWQSSEGESLWFESDESAWVRGGRISPNEEDLDLEYWWQNRSPDALHPDPRFAINATGTEFEDPDGGRTWVLTAGGWIKAEGYVEGAQAFAVQCTRGERVLAMAWNRGQGVSAARKPEVILESAAIVGKRIHVRGKVYLIKGSLDVLADRIRKELHVD